MDATMRFSNARRDPIGAARRLNPSTFTSE
jgi:hypothetical protein